MSSTHKCEVVPVVLQNHPNADSLSIVKVFDGYEVCVRTQDWIGVDKGVYIPPDSVVPDTDEFKFLEGHLRIKAKKLRGVSSYGMLVPVPDNGRAGEIGDDLAEIMNIQHYEPELSQMIKDAQGSFESPPPIIGVTYDIEPWQKFKNEFIDGEEVVITEKIHGCNSRYTFQQGQMYCGSHYHWVKEGNNLFWNILKFYPWVQAFCHLNPNVILYGEIFGAVQKDYNYGSTTNNPYQFRAFDVFANGKFLDYDYALGNASSDFLVPVLYRGPYSDEVMNKFVSGPSVLSGDNHIREGIVVKPVVERYSERLRGRLNLKFVSIDYLSGKKK
jgi:RNA ligase (TIGR02306 family)